MHFYAPSIGGLAVTQYLRMKLDLYYRGGTSFNPLFLDDVFRSHGQRHAVNVVFLSLLVFHGNAALKEYVTVTEISPGRLFHLLVLPTGRSRALKFASCTKTSFVRQYQQLYQLVRAKYNHKESEATNLLTV